VVIILCAVYVADAFGFRSPLTTTQVMSTLLSKHLQEPGLDELRNRSLIIVRERGLSRRVIRGGVIGSFRNRCIAVSFDLPKMNRVAL
jgi:hypothetical protein